MKDLYLLVTIGLFIFSISVAGAARLAGVNAEAPSRAPWEIDLTSNEIKNKSKEAAFCIARRQSAEAIIWVAYCESPDTQQACKGYFYSLRDQILSKRHRNGCLPNDFGGQRAIFYAWLVKNSVRYKNMSKNELSRALKKSGIKNFDYLLEQKHEQSNDYSWLMVANELAKVTFQDAVSSAFIEAAECQ